MSEHRSEERLNDPRVPMPAAPPAIAGGGGRGRNNGFFRSFLGMQATAENLTFIENNKILFLSGKFELSNPEQQSYCQMLHKNFFPHYQLLSVTSLLLLVCLIYYIVAVCLGLVKNTFLEVNEQTYRKLGVNTARLVYKGGVHRLVLSLILHINAIHCVSNLIAILLMVSTLEYSFGWWKTLLIYFASGIMGNIFSDLVSVDKANQMIKAGATNCLFGTVGLCLGYILINWSSLAFIGPIFKFKMFSYLLLMLVYLILFCDAASKVDVLGHVGGFVSGFLLAGVLPSLADGTWQLVWRIILVGLFVVMVLACFLCFYLAPQDGYSY